MERKNWKYDCPEVMTDLAGLRIVCFVLSDMELVSPLIEQIFRVDWDNSIDKFEELVEQGKMGYRGKNYAVTGRICYELTMLEGPTLLKD